mmetsp:Transcript_3475/g.9059  ORF Transcript_3475/g.9059 Transcript_3475/m.9059 type:complete len:288 (-) Transcript_3475:912-1775(-)
MGPIARMPTGLTSHPGILRHGGGKIRSRLPADGVVLVLLAQRAGVGGADHVSRREGELRRMLVRLGLLQGHGVGVPHVNVDELLPGPRGTVRFDREVVDGTADEYGDPFAPQYRLLVEDVVGSRGFFGHARIPEENVLLAVDRSGGEGRVGRAHPALGHVAGDEAHTELVEDRLHEVMKCHHLGLKEIIPVPGGGRVPSQHDVKFIVGHHPVQQLSHQRVPRVRIQPRDLPLPLRLVPPVLHAEVGIPRRDLGLRQFCTILLDRRLTVLGVDALQHPGDQSIGLLEE